MYSPGIMRVGDESAIVKTSPAFLPVTKVVINTGEELFSAGSDSGRVIQIKNPFGSQIMADDLLNRLAGYVHRPVQADLVEMDPLADIGDGFSIKGVYTGLYGVKLTFGRTISAHISSPTEFEIDNDTPAVSSKDRETSRGIGGLQIKYDKINLEFLQVSKELQAALGGVEATLSLYAKHHEDVKEAIARLTSRLSDAEASLVLKAYSSALDDISTAHAALVARVGKSEAKIETSITKLADSVQSIIRLTSALTIVDGALSTGNLGVRDKLIVGGNISLLGKIYIGDTLFTPQEITYYKNVSASSAKFTVYSNQAGNWTEQARNQSFQVGNEFYNALGTMKIKITAVGGASYSTETKTFLMQSKERSAADILSADDDDVLQNMNSML